MCASESQRTDDAPSPSPAAGRMVHVLLVDDDPSIRITLAETLATMGLQVDQAGDGTQALQMVDATPYGLALLDLWLPDIDGLSVLRSMRVTSPETRVIVITAHGSVESAVEAMKLGASDYLAKPFTPDTVREAVRGTLGREQILPAGDDYQIYLEMGRRALKRGEFDEAESRIRKALDIDRMRPQAFNLWGVLNEVRGNVYEAQQAYRHALELDAHYAPARANLRDSVDAPTRDSYYLSELKNEPVSNRLLRRGDLSGGFNRSREG